MYAGIRIINYRGFASFELADAARVNLLVGTNNCGKTSILEAIHFAASKDPSAFWSSLSRRGEHVQLAGYPDEISVSHVFHGHEPTVGSRLSIDTRPPRTSLSTNPDWHPSFVAQMLERDRESQEFLASLPLRARGRQTELFTSDEVDGERLGSLDLRLSWGDTLHTYPLSAELGLFTDMPRRIRRPMKGPLEPRGKSQFITTGGLSQAAIVSLFDETVLTPDEQTVVDALRTIEPGISRLATVNSVGVVRFEHRGGIAMLVDGVRVPIGTMGDGIWRLLGIALSLVRAEGGVLLIDEVDTGLHYSVLVDMWRLVTETARRLQIQVFATTHSRDCYEALAHVSTGYDDVALHRVERGSARAVAFSPTELRRAADRGIEVR